MIKDSQRNEIASFESSEPPPKLAFVGWRARRLSALEMAEGALLADIGVIFQVFIRFLPVGGAILQVLVPVIFAVIVFRRGFYVGCMSLCVALFVVCIVIGPGGAPFFVLESGAGLFLGLTMRQRFNQVLTCVTGILAGGAALWAVLLFYVFVGGGATYLLRALHLSYAASTRVAGLVFDFIHLDGFWRSLFPLIDSFVQWGFQHWLIYYYVLSCLACIPIVLGVYLVVNFFLRVLGYKVRPFPGYLLEGWLFALLRGLLALASWLVTLARWLFAHLPFRRAPVEWQASVRVPVLHQLKCEVRRLNIARLRQRRLEREARGKG